MAVQNESRGLRSAASSRSPDLGDTYLNPDQVAAQLDGRMSARAIRKRAKAGAIPATSFGHGRQRRWLLSPDVVDALRSELGGAE